jgi:hypothetical protein
LGTFRVRVRVRVRVREHGHLEALPRPFGLHQLAALVILVVPHAAHLVRVRVRVRVRVSLAVSHAAHLVRGGEPITGCLPSRY